MTKQEDIRRLRDEALELTARKKFTQAAALYDQLGRWEPKNGDWPKKQAESHRNAGHTDEAVRCFVVAARTMHEAGYLLKAMALCKVTLDLRPGDPAATSLLAVLNEERALRDAPVRAARPSFGPSLPSPPGPVEHTTGIGAGGLQSTALESIHYSLRSNQAPESEGVYVLDVDDLELEPRVAPADEQAGRSLSTLPLFGGLETAELARLLAAMTVVDLPAGAQLFAEGDPADAMYVVVEGRVSAVVVLADGPLELAQLGSDEFFGEIGLLSDQPRQASVLASEDSTLLRLSREAVVTICQTNLDFRRALIRFLKRRLVEDLLLTSDLFKPFGDQDRTALGRLFKFKEIEGGTRLIEAGRTAPGLFVLLTGRARALADGGATLGILRPGDVFGEISLVENSGAVADVVVERDCFVLEMPRKYFREVIMTHPAVLEYVAGLADLRKRSNAGQQPPEDEHVILV